MRLPRRLRLRLISLFRRARVETDLNDELRDYLELEIEHGIKAGLSAEEARRQAIASLEGAERLKEECRDARGVSWLEDAISDTRYALRTLRKAPAFTFTVVTALAFCIGVNTAIFSVVDTVLFRPLPFPEQERLVAVTEGVPGLGFPILPFSCPDYLFVVENNQSFEATGIYRTQAYEVSGAGQPRRVNGARLTASLFGVLGIAPAIGRNFTAEEDEQTRRVVVLAHGFAATVFGSPEAGLGRTLLLDRIPYTVVGVMPRGFSFPIRGSRFNGDPADLFVPVSWTPDDRQQNVSGFDYSMVARLKPNVTIPQAGAELRSLIQRIVADYPPILKRVLERTPSFSLESHIVPFREEYAGSVQRPLLLLLAAVGVVLLIGCADVANLMFSRMVGRQREFALRSALGAGGGRLARQALAEGLVLSIAGGIIGLFLALWALPLLIRLAPDSLPRMNEVGLNWRMMMFVAAISFVTPLLFCLGPLVSVFRSALVNQLRGDGRTNTHGRHQQWIMSAAVVVQFSLAFLLLASAGLLFRSLLKAAESNPGFRPAHVIRAQVALPETAYKTLSEVDGVFSRLLDRVGALPGVRQSGAISDLPTGSSSNVVITMEGRGNATERTDMIFCRGSALEALGIALQHGRFLRPDDYIGGPHSVVISESLAKRAWPDSNPIGRRVRFGIYVPENNEPWMTVVGVVADVKARLTSNSPRSLLIATPREWVKQMSVIAQTFNDPLYLSNSIRTEIARLDPDLAIGKIETVDQVLRDSLSAERFRTRLLLCFALAALLLATLGIAGLLAYNAAQRAQEFGVRIALGANRRDLLLLVFRHSLRLSSAGIVIGFVASVAATRAISALLYETSPLDPATFITVPAILFIVALAAALFPAWRVVRTDPITALRGD